MIGVTNAGWSGKLENGKDPQVNKTNPGFVFSTSYSTDFKEIIKIFFIRISQCFIMMTNSQKY